MYIYFPEMQKCKDWDITQVFLLFFFNLKSNSKIKTIKSLRGLNVKWLKDVIRLHNFWIMLDLSWPLVIQKLCMVACRWWGQNNSIYWKYEPNRLRNSSSKRNICIWSCRASISLKLLLKKLVSWPWLLSICESWHRTICMLDFDKLCGCSTSLLFL